MKKALAIILSVMMLMSTLVACGSKTDDSGDANNDAAASYPTKNVNVIVPFSAGGNTGTLSVDGKKMSRAAERGDQP